MKTIKFIIVVVTPFCRRIAGVHRFAKLLEVVASDIRNGRIEPRR